MSGLIKKLIKGINKAIEIDSANEENIDKIKTKKSSLFLFLSKCVIIFLKRLNEDNWLLLVFVSTIDIVLIKH